MEDSSSALVYFYKNRKLFFAAIILGGIMGVSMTFFIPKRYLSTAIIYPYNSHTKNQIVSNPQFGYEVETEQLLQLLESKSMMDRTINEFNLIDYYELDSSSIDWRSKLNLEYIRDVNFFRSKYLSVVINVTTKEPELSAKIANYQVQEINKYRDNIFEENRTLEFNTVANNYFTSEKKCIALKDSIYKLKGGNEALLFNFVESLDDQNFNASDFVDNAELENLVSQYLYEQGEFARFRIKYTELKRLVNSPLPKVYSIDVATPSYKKVSPSFTMNGIIGALVLFLLTFAVKLGLDKWSSIKATVAAE